MFKIIQKQKIIDLNDEIVHSCWIYKENNQDLVLNNYFADTKLSDDICLSGQDRKLVELLINAIKNAREIICLSTYIFSSKEIRDAIIEASKRGVRVYMITASNKHLKSLPEEDDDFNKRMYDQMRTLFNEMQSLVKIRTSENFHAKFLIIDPNLEEVSKGFLLTANIDTKGLVGREIEGKYRVNPEICVSLDKSEIQDLFKQFCLGFWELSKEESKSDGFFPIVNKPKQIHHFNKLLINSANNKSLKNEIINLISNTHGRIIICTYGISDDNEIFDLIINELEKNREVIILTRPRIFKMKALNKLVEKGAIILGHPDIHAKVLIIESEHRVEVLVMTANFEQISFKDSFETGLILDSKRAETVLKIAKTWINNFPMELKSKTKRGDLFGKVLVWNKENDYFNLKYVIAEKLKYLNPEYAETFSVYRDHVISDSKLKIPDEKSEIFKKVINIYNVKPPIKPENAKEYFLKDSNEKLKKGKHNFPLFQLNEKIYLVIRSEEELDKAEEFASKINAKVVTLEKYLKE